MKVLTGILSVLLFSTFICRSQNISSDTIRLSTLPTEGILLDKGWKFHAGDDTNWSNPEFNDGSWQNMNPSLDIRHIPQIINFPVFWLRLKLSVDSPLMNQTLGITISQVGASEIYLDGTLLYKWGIVNKSYSSEKTRYRLNRPYAIQLGKNQIQTIAIRYSYNPQNFLIRTEYQNSCFRLIINKVDQTYSNYQTESRTRFMIEFTQVALWLVLSLLCFSLYFSFRKQKEYWYIGVYSLLILLGGLLSGIIAREFYSTSLVSIILLLSSVFYLLSSLFALNGMCRLCNQKKGWAYYGLLLYSLFILISFFLLYDQSENLFILYFIFYSIEFSRICYKALRNKRPGITILFISSILFFILFALVIIANYYHSLAIGHLLAFIGTATGPICFSIFMAGEFARTGIALQSRVKEVEQLSEKAIAQEREKQQILSSQNETLETRVSERTSQLNESLRNLQSAQTQLIQSEKMASLGELTAGIAHEIQNPLNFVNNFSEINSELIAELKNEIEGGNKQELLSIAETLNENEKKIMFHGKRADAIVKGMLQHSRVSSGQKEKTDLNRLVEEYLRLSFQGLRTRDSTFNSKIEAQLDHDISIVNVFPQDIGRVLLNLFNNAFYAVSEKKKQMPERYEPVVSVITKKTNDGVEIRIRDNGIGIPNRILDKIFQPFFTTKPTGQGTGLGLSLSYDVIKAHGGEIRVDSKEGEYSEFTIILHLTSTNNQ